MRRKKGERNENEERPTYLTQRVQPCAPRLSPIRHKHSMVPSQPRANDPLALERLGGIRVRQSYERERVGCRGRRGDNAVGGDVRRGEGRWEGVGELVVLVAADEVGLGRGSVGS